MTTTYEAIAENIINKTLNASIINEEAAKEGLPSKSSLATNKNMIGAIIGASAAVALEVLSPTGSKTSAVVAAVAAGGLAYYCRDMITIAPQSTTIATGIGLTTGYVGMCAGRIAACYFPGNLED